MKLVYIDPAFNLCLEFYSNMDNFSLPFFYCFQEY
jgi:hypothetical protein